MSDNDDECGDTDEHIIHSAATFNPQTMMSASDSGATSSNQVVGGPAFDPSGAGSGAMKIDSESDSQQQMAQKGNQNAAAYY